MPRSRRYQEPPPRESREFTSEDATKAKARLQVRIQELQALDPKQPDFLERAKIALDNALSTVRDVLGRDSDESYTFHSTLIGNTPVSTDPFGEYDRDETGERQETIRRAVPRLENLLRIVDEKTVAQAPVSGQRVHPTVATLSRRVFVVHGHDEGLKQTVARVLERLDLEPIILHEWPDKGRTIIEKLEDYSDVGYAVVLMTGDDRGGPKDAGPESYQLRARQNVLLELGLFLGKLGRERVCILYKPEVEMPSDYQGVLYVELDQAGAWRFRLAEEINAVGIQVDLNRLPR